MGQWSKATSDQRWEGNFSERLKISCLLLFQDCRQAPLQVRLIRRLPQDSSSTSSSPARLSSGEEASGNRRDPIQNPKLPKKTTTMEQPETACETSRSGYRSSQIISKIQKCQHPHTFLMIQIRNTKVASRKHGIYTHFPHDRNREICQRTKITRAPC